LARRGWDESEFLVHIAGEPKGAQTRVQYGHSKFVRAADWGVPSWMPGFSMSNLDALEDGAMRGLLRAYESNPRPIHVEVAQSLAAVTWGKRLPISGARLWEMLAAHSFNETWRDEFCHLFDFGVALLVGTIGRQPVGTRNAPAMSVNGIIPPLQVSRTPG
jgi:hypothetical protein